ncbi:hypothetical protein LCGC14_1085090 [marine sediment metagenome]|uniref:Uncharacterized protein n=1 Tax=marine sediment metagenome TaxID=412755 RepID=A0A0F9PX91_9ZZZZ
MKNVITKVDAQKYRVSFGIKPNGAQGKQQEDGEPFGQVQLSALFDLSKVNPNAVDVPTGIMEHALSSIVIEHQGIVRGSLTGKTFEDKYKDLEKIATGTVPTIEVGKKEAGKVSIKARNLLLETKNREYPDIFRRGKGLIPVDDLIDMADIDPKDWAEAAAKMEGRIAQAGKKTK